jgi:hypothetical protein
VQGGYPIANRSAGLHPWHFEIGTSAFGSRIGSHADFNENVVAKLFVVVVFGYRRTLQQIIEGATVTLSQSGESATQQKSKAERFVYNIVHSVHLEISCFQAKGH